MTAIVEVCCWRDRGHESCRYRTVLFGVRLPLWLGLLGQVSGSELPVGDIRRVLEVCLDGAAHRRLAESMYDCN